MALAVLMVGDSKAVARLSIVRPLGVERAVTPSIQIANFTTVRVFSRSLGINLNSLRATPLRTGVSKSNKRQQKRGPNKSIRKKTRKKRLHVQLSKSRKRPPEIVNLRMPPLSKSGNGERVSRNVTGLPPTQPMLGR